MLSARDIYWFILKILPMKPALYLLYFRGYHKILNLKNPKYYGEKIQWLKINGGLEELGKYVDKYDVRQYIENTIGKEYLIKSYGVFENVDDIDFSILPERFVLKCTNGTQAVLICKDKSTFDIESAKKTMKKWLEDDFYRVKKEYQYKYVKNRILIEEYMEDDSGELRDYKFYCFNGEPEYYSIFSNRYSNKTVDTFSIDGVFLEDFLNGSKNVKLSEKTIKLDNLDEFKYLAKELSKPFTYVRVDFYMVNGRIYFGELTFTDGAGSEAMYPIEKYDVLFASMIPMTRIKK